MTSSDLDTTTTSGAGHAKDFGWTVDSHQYSLLPFDDARIGDHQNSFTIGIANGQIAVKLNLKLTLAEVGAFLPPSVNLWKFG